MYFWFGELTLLQGFTASAGIGSITVSFHANIQVFPRPPTPQLFAVFVIVHLEFSSEYVLERTNKWNTWECIKTKTYTFIPASHSSVRMGSHSKLKIHLWISSKAMWEFNLSKIEHIKYWAVWWVCTFYFCHPDRISTQASATSNPDCNKIVCRKVIVFLTFLSIW